MQACFKMSKVQLSTGIFLILLLGSGCRTPVQEQQESEPDPVPEQFIRVNQYIQQRQQDQISAFLERVGWHAETTPSGLWIVMETPGKGKRIEENSRVTYTFESTLLTGTPCYRATRENPRVITIGAGGVESGVEEGMKHLSEGAKAIFLIPPHLAHGNFGDRDKIPGNSVLIYHVEVLKVD
jgi:FKBP-type peptidyl-prolyl cis-trans isomerase FkpA